MMIRAIVLMSALLFASSPEVIVIDSVRPEEPEAIKCECGPVTEYAWTDDELNQVAKV